MEYTWIAKHLIYPLGGLVLSINVTRYLDMLEESQWWTEEKIITLQENKLRNLLEHAYHKVPYYNRIFKESGLLNRQCIGIGDLCKLPILTKALIRDNFEDIKALDINKYKPMANATGGSTGAPLKYFISKDLVAINWAGTYRGWGWAGYKLGDKRITLGGSSLVPNSKPTVLQIARQKLERNMPLTAVSLDSEKCSNYIRLIRKYNPQYIYGYPSAIYLLAEHCRIHGIEDISFDAVFSTAEMLLPQYRELIEDQFGCRVFDMCGSYDGGAQAMECEEHNGFHISAEKVIVEIVDDDGNPVEPGRTGRIIVTDLHNYAMPFIRYENGDIGSLSNEQCPCGRGLPLLESLEGRTADIIRLSNGTSITGPAVTLIFKGCNVKQYQLVQTSHNQLVVNIVKGENYSEADECHFMRVLKHHAGDGVSVNVNYCDTIPVTRAGKYRFIINQCSNTG
jgi:phenylacetate-CoA ligase